MREQLPRKSPSMPADRLEQPHAHAFQHGCDLCGALSARELYTGADRLRNSDRIFTIARCEGCGVLRTLPEMSDQELGAFYPSDYWGEEPSSEWIRKSQAEKTSFLRRCGLTGGPILDVGCGAGFFLRALDPASWQVFGVETGRPAARAATRALGEGRVFEGKLLQSGFESGVFDAITMWSSLEHMNTPRAGLMEARRIMKRGGSLIVQVPNAGGYQLRLFGGDWFALDAPRHRYHFTSGRLEALLAEMGFEVYAKTFVSASHNSHALRQSLKASLKRKGYPAFAAFYLAVPFIKPIDWLMSGFGEGATITIAARAV